MFIKRTKKRVNGKDYVNHLLVESVMTPKGPRHHVICSLGNLEPAPKEEWLGLARKLESALSGQVDMFSDERVEALAARVRKKRGRPRSVPSVSSEHPSEAEAQWVSVRPDDVAIETPREAGPAHVGHQMWKRLELDTILESCEFSAKERILVELLVLNRLIHPASEHATPSWVRRTALDDILGENFETLSDTTLYRTLDLLHPFRVEIESILAERERSLFNLDESVYLYDLTSTYFEGQCLDNPQARRGYSRDKRPDCKQVVVGLVLDREGFPKAHEVFDGNRSDSTTVNEMLQILEERTGKRPGTTVVVDRGMSSEANLKEIRSCGYHYIVASRQGERNEHMDEFEDEAGWEEIIRLPSPTNPRQKKSRVFVKRSCQGEEVHILCVSDARAEKDRAIRELHEKRFVADLQKLKNRIAKGALVEEKKIHEAVGRLKERYPRVARYYEVRYVLETHSLEWDENREKKEQAKRLDGGYLLRTDRTDLSSKEIWRTYILLTRVESAFRSMKSPLMERPIFHHLEHRVQAHIFLCVLAYHLLVSIEKHFLDRGIHTSWGTLREQLSTHQVMTVVLPTKEGRVLRIRKGSTPEPIHREIYETLGIPETVMKPKKTWSCI